MAAVEKDLTQSILWIMCGVEVIRCYRKTCSFTFCYKWFCQGKWKPCPCIHEVSRVPFICRLPLVLWTWEEFNEGHLFPWTMNAINGIHLTRTQTLAWRIPPLLAEFKTKRVVYWLLQQLQCYHNNEHSSHPSPFSCQSFHSPRLEVGVWWLMWQRHNLSISQFKRLIDYYLCTPLT